MDGTRFNRLVREWLSTGTRRAVLRSLVAIPLGGVGAWLLDPTLGGAVGDEKTSHKQRCRRRKGKGKGHHGQRKSCKARHGGNRKNKKQRCTPDSTATTCAGKCGPVKNNCKKSVDCGPCLCDPACPICQICDEETGACVLDPAQLDDECGEPGQTCQSNGDCSCTATSCAACETCQSDGFCSEPCGGEGCCTSDGTCAQGDTPAACGTGGATCDVCTGDEVCSAVRICVVPRCGEPGGVCRVFLSSESYTGDLGGRGGADAKCQELADGVALGGTFRAWISDSTGSPASDPTFTKGSGPYRLLAPPAPGFSDTVAENWDDLVSSGDLGAPIVVVEFGSTLVNADIPVWTHTLPNGLAGGEDGAHCGNWQVGAASEPGDTGQGAVGASPAWTADQSAICAALGRLYCFEQAD